MLRNKYIAIPLWRGEQKGCVKNIPASVDPPRPSGTPPERGLINLNYLNKFADLNYALCSLLFVTCLISTIFS